MSVEDVRAQLALEAELGGWQVHRASVSTCWLDYVEIPAGHYYAASTSAPRPHASGPNRYLMFQ